MTATTNPEPNLPLTYIPGFLSKAKAASLLETLTTELAWERRSDAPRSEYYCNDSPDPYTYGRGRGTRTYYPQPWHPSILDLRQRLRGIGLPDLDTCFLNRYRDNRDHLGWHADDSPSMDPARPIAVVTLGAERDILFRSNLNPEDKSAIRLHMGSLLIMHSGCQSTHQHSIPKASFACPPRISLTFRGYIHHP